MFKTVLAGLLISCGALAGHTNNPSRNWEELREKSLSCGLADEQIDRLMAACRKNGWSTEQTDALLCPVYRAQAESLPWSCVFLKVEEGLAKGIPWKEIQGAADHRLDSLFQADRLILSVRPHRGRQHEHLVMHTCMALESGLPPEVLENIFSHPDTFRYGRMIPVIEAGETFQLAGFPPAHTQHILNDCLDRNLKPGEVMRVVAFILDAHRSGQDFQSIHEGLWNSADQ